MDASANCDALQIDRIGWWAGLVSYSPIMCSLTWALILVHDRREDSRFGHVAGASAIPWRPSLARKYSEIVWQGGRRMVAARL